MPECTLPSKTRVCSWIRLVSDQRQVLGVSCADHPSDFATDAYYVLRQSDDELKSVSAWNTYDPANPLVNFGDFLNGESTVQEDLVVYYNLGMHHVPHTGDLPNVSPEPSFVGFVGSSRRVGGE